VVQDDRLLPNLTVRQTFWYAAALRVGRQLSNHELHERVRNGAHHARGGRT